jgi:hypothetical protein
MKWYEIVMVVLVMFIGAYLGIKMKEFRKNRYHNDSWKNRNK